MLPSPAPTDSAGRDPSVLFQKACVYRELPGVLLSGVGVHWSRQGV